MTGRDASLVATSIGPDGVASVQLTRPDALNALSPRLVSDLIAAVRRVGADETVRVLVLSGTGRAFCAGGDIASLREVAEASYDETVADATRFAELYRVVADCPAPLIVRAHGACLGGGTALVACGDLAIAGTSARFGCTEVRVGVIPSVVAPYVLGRVGPSAARRLLLTGARLDAREALRIGLVDQVVSDDQLDTTVSEAAAVFLAGIPAAQRATKSFLRELSRCAPDEAVDLTIRRSAEFRTTAGSRDALAAFLARMSTAKLSLRRAGAAGRLSRAIASDLKAVTM